MTSYYTPSLQSTQKVIERYLEDMGSGEIVEQRLGQYFVNKWIKGAWPELFYEGDWETCVAHIEQWLSDNCYYFGVPDTLEERQRYLLEGVVNEI